MEGIKLILNQIQEKYVINIINIINNSLINRDYMYIFYIRLIKVD